MYRVSDFNKEFYKTGEAAKIIGVTPLTIMNYDKSGKLKIYRTETNRRIVMREDLIAFLDKLGLIVHDDYSKKDVIYSRVSSHEQKEKGDLDRQVLFLVENIRDLHNPVILKEVGSGLNDRRPKLLQLISMVMNDEVSRVYITYKDRLTRFGFNYLETIFRMKNVEIIVVKDQALKKTVQEELVDDMMSLIASFSGKLYGLRSKSNKQKTGSDICSEVTDEK